MPAYTCKICNFSTYKSSNAKQHQQSKKHLRNIDSYILSKGISEDTHKGIPKKPQKIHKKNYTCNNCGIIFTAKSNLYRHKKKSCRGIQNIKNDDSSEKFTKIIKKLEKDNQELKEDNKNLITLATKNANSMSNVTEAINTTSQVAKKSLSMMSYAIKNLSKAPNMKSIDYDSATKLLELEYTGNHTLEYTILYNFDNNMLHKYVGKIIVKEYKKENPQKQSIWSSDTSRLNFVIKQMVGENDVSEWISDKSGIKTGDVIKEVDGTEIKVY